jgi:hypothetical protein
MQRNHRRESQLLTAVKLHRQESFEKEHIDAMRFDIRLRAEGSAFNSAAEAASTIKHSRWKTTVSMVGTLTSDTNGKSLFGRADRSFARKVDVALAFFHSFILHRKLRSEDSDRLWGS